MDASVCPIFIGNDTGRLDTSAHEPDSQFDTALRVLEIDNDLVRRQLIINHGIEQMLLIEDLQDASKILFEGERPKNVKRCYCIDKTDRRRGFHLSFSRLGEPVQSPVPTFTRRPRMKTDIETQIGMQRDAVESLKRALHELEKDRGEVRAAFDRCKQAVARHERESRDLQIQVQKAEDHVEALQEAIDKDSVADGELETMKKGLLDAKEDKELHERFYQDSVNAMDTQMEKLRSIKRELAEKDQEIASCEQKIKGLQTEEATHSHRRRKALGEKNIIQDRIEKARNDKVSLEGKREVQAEVVLGYNRQASAVSERVPVPPGETASSVDKKLEKLKEDLDRYHAQMGATREEIATAAAEAKAKYERSRSQYEEFEETMQKLKETLINRRSRWDKFRSYISAKAKVQFTYFLSERSFRGTLLADHQKKLLDIQVEPDITKDNSNGRNAKTLSGGEKSFSQICLLLSLWEAMGSPIRCLDEFDVYMDLVNRSMTIEMLMAGARRSVGRQFILITPGSRDNIQLAPDVRVKELKPPERGQTTLNFPG
ncbi:hypothetical protein AJ80_05308 [Polytolypa hystricis UAMH7299]|uniref:RecF/RecN/SMC N-terminal domain-containing protein n=1 Tax=Polytolypa hystricis (strain UAMH7299) TaxID=1447883 RepID=A0A2B7Y502_POLH7|nr:hypothetical protein AJ80_05308 [Polytolypa hystricis UAMH7299]